MIYLDMWREEEGEGSRGRREEKKREEREERRRKRKYIWPRRDGE
jgi:hypothetical protein